MTIPWVSLVLQGLSHIETWLSTDWCSMSTVRTLLSTVVSGGVAPATDGTSLWAMSLVRPLSSSRFSGGMTHVDLPKLVSYTGLPPFVALRDAVAGGVISTKQGEALIAGEVVAIHTEALKRARPHFPKER